MSVYQSCLGKERDTDGGLGISVCKMNVELINKAVNKSHDGGLRLQLIIIIRLTGERV